MMEFTTEVTDVLKNNSAAAIISTPPIRIDLRSHFTVIIALFHVVVTSGIPGNLLVFLAYIKFHALRSPTTLVILNQSVADLLTCIIITPYTWFNFTHSGADFIGQQKYLCLLFLFCGTVVVVSSAFNVFVLSMERFIAIVMPFRYYEWVTMKSAKISLAILWSIVVISTCPPLLGWNSFKSGSGCSPARVYAEDYVTYMFFIPNMTLSIVTAIINVIIGVTALKIKKRISDENVIIEGDKKQPSKSDFKIMKMFMMVTGAFYATWLPYTALFLVFYTSPSWLRPNIKLLVVLFDVAKVLVFANPAINSFVYASKNRSIRESIIKLFKTQQ